MECHYVQNLHVHVTIEFLLFSTSTSCPVSIPRALDSKRLLLSTLSFFELERDGKTSKSTISSRSTNSDCVATAFDLNTAQSFRECICKEFQLNEINHSVCFFEIMIIFLRLSSLVHNQYFTNGNQVLFERQKCLCSHVSFVPCP